LKSPKQYHFASIYHHYTTSLLSLFEENIH